MFPNLWNSNIRLAGLSDEELMKLSQETGLAFPMLKAQQRAEMASTGNAMPGDENEAFVPTVEIRLITNPKNPRKARKKNIKMLRKTLRPPRYWFGFFSIYRYNAAHECACCGADIRRFIEGSDNAYAHIIDEDTRMSLADIYWFDEETGQPRKPHARTHGDIGDELNSTLCPAHLHIFHTLKKLTQEEMLQTDGLSRPTSIGTKFLRVPGLSAPKNRNRSTTESLIKYEPFFRMIQQDTQHQKGITMTQHPNPVSGVADLVTITFDLRALQIQDSMKQNSTIGVPLMTPQQQQSMVNTVPPSTPEAGA
tara:strand:+ start:10547 stop:11473 length:927 start_codon:yes stop_codon:yes gene_type:complete